MFNENYSAALDVRESSPADLSPLWDKVQQLIEASVAPETRRAYDGQLRKFITWCNSNGILSTFPASPEVLAAYIAYLAECKASCSTVDQSMAAIATAHRAEGFASPTESLLVRKVIKGYRREHGTAPHKKDAATLEIIRCLLSVNPQYDSPDTF